MSVVEIAVERARDTVDRLQAAASHFDTIDAQLLAAMSWADLSVELADARMLTGELIDEVPALARMIEFKTESMLAADTGYSMSAQYSQWYSAARQTLTAGLDDDFHAGADPGGTYSLSYRGGFDSDGTGTSAGRSLIANLLLTCGDGALIAQDEFQIIRTDNHNTYIVVLPGVTDLSSPDLGLNSEHRTVRDLDQYAMRSARSSELADNRYAVMVKEAMERAGVPFGSTIALVGHSYGADTALDLAASDEFNGGPEGYNVTHVVAAGYHSGPQLGDVAPSTEVLVLQNHHDVAAIVEAFSHDTNQMVGDIGDRDFAGALGNDIQSSWETMKGITTRTGDAGQFLGGSVVNFGSNLINTPAGWLGRDDDITGYVDWGDFDDIFLLEDGVTNVTDTQTTVVFEGDFEGFGHHPNNYAEHVTATQDGSTTQFFGSMFAAGYSGRMERWSVDVSVPRADD